MTLQEEKYGVQLFSFKEWLLNEGLEQYVANGNITLYRFGRDHGPVSVANPKLFGNNAFTQNDAKLSGIPRVFFYVDLKDKEQFFFGSTLYKAIVPARLIYDLEKDPEKLTDLARAGDRVGGYRVNVGVLNFSKLFSLIKKAGYNGVYYDNGKKIVNWFVPIQLEKVVDERKELKRKVKNVSLDI